MKKLYVENIIIDPDPNGVCLIDTIILCDEGELIAVADTFMGIRFSWIGTFIFNKNVVIE